MLSEWIVIRTFTSRMETEAAKAMLESYGIQAMVQSDDQVSF